MGDIYSDFDKATRGMEAVVVLKDGALVARVVVIYKTAVTAYVHWLGAQMTKGRATGYGYDRATAACSAAAKRLAKPEREGQGDDAADAAWEAFRAALMKDDGWRWQSALAHAGFTVHQAV